MKDEDKYNVKVRRVAGSAGFVKKKKNRKRLHVSTDDRKFMGVCGGIAETYNIDPTVVRILTIAAALITAAIPVFVIYLILWLIMPEEKK